MADLSLNISGLAEVIDEFSLPKGSMEELSKMVLGEVTKQVVRNWEAEARRGLGSTRAGYLKGIRVMEQGRMTNAIILFGKFNNMLEQGISAFDMKVGFSKSQKVKTSKEGNWYLHIPFRIGAPSSLAEAEPFAGKMPEDVHKVLKALKPPEGSTKQVSRGVKLKELPVSHQKPQIRKAVGGYENYQHKSPIFEGAFKSTQQGQSKYGSIRTASAKSDPNSWIHKGIKAYDFSGKALRRTNIQTVVDNTIDAFLVAI